jgi:hypothetical protein
MIRPFTYEHRSQPLLPRRHFLKRLLGHAAVAGLIIACSLALGVVGYHVTEGFSWIDSLLNASMILGGMGPVDAIHSVSGKYFASFYALFSGVVFLVTVGILIAPAVHRLLHRLHLESTKE